MKRLRRIAITATFLSAFLFRYLEHCFGLAAKQALHCRISSSVHRQGFPASPMDVGLSAHCVFDFYPGGDWMLDSTSCEVEIESQGRKSCVIIGRITPA